MVDVLTQVPKKLVAGDTFAWERDLTDYPAGTWTLTYYFSNDAESFQVIASASGTKHVVSVAAATTSAYVAGRYRWHARADDGTTFVTIDDGWLEVQPDPTADKVDFRSHARKMFDAIEATLEGQASKQQLDLISYSFGAVNVNRDRELLIKWRDKYAAELVNEGGTGNKDRRNHYVRFARP